MLQRKAEEIDQISIMTKMGFEYILTSVVIDSVNVLKTICWSLASLPEFPQGQVKLLLSLSFTLTNIKYNKIYMGGIGLKKYGILQSLKCKCWFNFYTLSHQKCPQ